MIDLRNRYQADYLLEIQETGQLNGKSARCFNVPGRRSAFTSTTSLNDVGEGIGIAGTALFLNLTGAEAISVVSSNANDDGSPAGTGARTIKMTYIDTNYAIVETADITLNGTSSVSVLASGCLALLWIEVTSAGSNGSPVGNLTVTSGAPTSGTLAYIPAGSNKSLNAFFMVPDGYTGYVICWSGGNIQNSQDMRLRATVNTTDRTLSTVYHFQDNKNIASNTNFDHDLPALKYPARCKIKVSTISSSTAINTRADADFSVIIIAD